MAIDLRIVGIFYDRNDIPDTVADADGNTTVKAVLDYAVANRAEGTDNFKYVSGVSNPSAIPNGKPSVTAFFANYTAPPTSQASQAIYPPGEYFLSESLVGNPAYEVWQFYVFDGKLGAGGRYQQPNPRIKSFADVTVPAGGTVVWRLVKILSGPNKVPVVYRRALDLNAQPVAV